MHTKLNIYVITKQATFPHYTESFLKLVDKLTYLGSSVSSTEKDIDTRLKKAWTVINRLSIIWKSDLTDKIKHSFFQAAVVSIRYMDALLGRLKKKIDGNYTRMLRAILNTQQGTNYTANCLPSRKLYKLDQPDTQDTAGEARTNSSVMYSYGTSHMAKKKQDDHIEHTYSSYVRIRDVDLKTCQKRCMIGRSGERGSGISLLPARHDDDDDDSSFSNVKIVRETELFTLCKTTALEKKQNKKTTPY